MQIHELIPLLMGGGKRPNTSPTVLAQDTFTGADGTSLAGRALTVGGVWLVSSGTWTIQGGKAVCTVSTGDNWITTDVGAASYTYTVDIALSTEGVLVFRFVDDTNYLLLVYTAAMIRLYQRVAGVFTELTNAVVAAGATDTVKVAPNAGNVKVYLNNALVIDFNTAQFQTATRIGLRVNNDMVSSFDNLLVTTP